MTRKHMNDRFYREEEPIEEPHGNLRGGYIEPLHEHIPYTIDEYHTTISPQEYSKFIEASYTNNENAEKLGRDMGYTLDQELSNENNKVFMDDKDDDIIIAYTGTRKNEDYITDLALATGLGPYTSRFKNSQKLVDTVRKKYNRSHVLSIGDSLGGSLAEYVGDKTDRVITLNKGTSIFDVGKNIRPNQIDIRHKGDYISMLSKYEHGGKEKLEIDDGKTGLFASHDYRNIKNLKRTRL
jgi:hypothetical protein